MDNETNSRIVVQPSVASTGSDSSNRNSKGKRVSKLMGKREEEQKKLYKLNDCYEFLINGGVVVKNRRYHLQIYK
eukprot:Pgem_evm1s16728